jgi:LysM repeat protein
MTKSMMFRINILLLLVLANFSFGQTNIDKVHWIDGKKYMEYKVQAKDTWTALAGRFSISVKDLQGANKSVSNLQTGKSIYVPFDKTAVASPVAKEAKQKQEEKNVYHTIQKGETLYRISKMYNQSIADIKKWNNLSTDNVPLGKSLIVGKGNSSTTVKTTTAPEAPPVVKTDPSTEVKTAAATEIKKEVAPKIDSPLTVNPVAVDKTPVTAEPTPPKSSKTDTKAVATTDGSIEKIIETGVATWLNDQELNQNKFYALHRTAPMGTIIKVTNRMTNNSVFVKVVGVLPDTGDNTNVIIKITQAAAQRIGAIDQKFTAELSYGINH